MCCSFYHYYCPDKKKSRKYDIYEREKKQSKNHRQSLIVCENCCKQWKMMPYCEQFENCSFLMVTLSTCITLYSKACACVSVRPLTLVFLPQLHEEYRKLNLARQKKKPNMKKERESVKKVLKEWWSIYQTLDDSYDPWPHQSIVMHKERAWVDERVVVCLAEFGWQSRSVVSREYCLSESESGDASARHWIIAVPMICLHRVLLGRQWSKRGYASDRVWMYSQWSQWWSKHSSEIPALNLLMQCLDCMGFRDGWRSGIKKMCCMSQPCHLQGCFSCFIHAKNSWPKPQGDSIIPPTIVRSGHSF